MPDDTTPIETPTGQTTPPPDTTAGAGNDTPPPESPWFHSIWDPENPGQFKEKYQEALPEDYEEYKSVLANYRDFKTLLKSHKDSLTAARQKAGIKPLTPESTPEEVAAFRRELGIPETPYEFPKPEALPEGIEWQEERAAAFGKWAHEKNLTPAQAKEAMDLYVKFIGEDYTRATEAQKQAYADQVAAEQEALRTEFGGKLSSAVAEAQRIAVKYKLPPEVMDPGSDKFAGITVLKMANDLAAALGESKLPPAAAVVNRDPMRQYNEIIDGTDKERHELWKKGDKATLALTQRLLKEALARSAA